MDSSQESGMPTQVDSKSESHDVMSLVSTLALSYSSAINVNFSDVQQSFGRFIKLTLQALLGKPRVGKLSTT